MKFVFPGSASPAIVNNTATTTGSDAAHAGTHSEKPDDKDIPRASSSLDNSSDDDSVEKIDSNAEHGVQAVQAMTQAWSKSDILAAYIM